MLLFPGESLCFCGTVFLSELGIKQTIPILSTPHLASDFISTAAWRRSLLLIALNGP